MDPHQRLEQLPTPSACDRRRRKVETRSDENAFGNDTSHDVHVTMIVEAVTFQEKEKEDKEEKEKEE